VINDHGRDAKRQQATKEEHTSSSETEEGLRPRWES